MALQFCRECNNILYPKYENRSFVLSCNKCHTSINSTNNIVYCHFKNERIEHKNINYFLNDVTLPVLTKKCAKCDNNKCVSYMRKSAEKALDEYYICTSCMYEFTE